MTTEFVPGWYPDPVDHRRLRHWNGTTWTRDTWDAEGNENFITPGPVPPSPNELMRQVDEPETSFVPRNDPPISAVPQDRGQILGWIGLVVLAIALVAVGWAVGNFA